jgi:6-phosphogluconolactonase
MRSRLRAAGRWAIGFAFVTAVGAGQFVYVANYGSNNVSGFRIEPGGTLTSVGAPAPAGTFPYTLAVHPSGQFLYAFNAVSGDVSAYKIEVVGTLTALGPAFPVGARPFSAAVDTTGQFVYVGLEGSARIVAYQLNAVGALTTQLGIFPTGEAPRSVTVSPTGRFLYVANVNSGTVGAYAIQPDGRLAAIGAAASGGQYPFHLAVDPAGKFVYAANWGSQSVAMYSIGSSGALTSLGLPAPSGPLPSFAAIEPLGRFLYVGSDNGTVSAYRIGADGTLGLISLTQMSGAVVQPASMAFDQTGTFAYVADRGTGQVIVVQIQADGTLARIGVYPAGVAPIAVAVNRCSLAPSINGLAVNPDVLWPPNHQMVPVTITYEVTSACGLPDCTLAVGSSDPANGNDPDWLVLNPHQVELKAERYGGSQGRVYTITVGCTDASGNRVSSATTVVVPANQKR